MLGIDPADAQREVRRTAARQQASITTGAAPTPQTDLPDARDPRFQIERETLKLVVQRPDLAGRSFTDVAADDFTHPAYRAVWTAVEKLGGPTGAAGSSWVAGLGEAVVDDRLRSLVNALAVEKTLSATEPTTGYVVQHVARLRELTTMRRIADLKSRLQRTNPVEQATDYNRMFGELVALEQHRRQLREQAVEGGA
jgi:DNA primase